MTATTRPYLSPAHRALLDFCPTDGSLEADHMGRLVIVVPDAVALALVEASNTGWREFADVADGESAEFGPETAVAVCGRELLRLAATFPIPDGADDDAAVGIRRQAGYGSVYAFIVGESGWDRPARWWNNYPATAHLHPTGSLHRLPTGGFQFAG